MQKMKLRKSDLGIENYNYIVDGVFLPTFFGIKLPIPIKLKLIMDSEFTPVFLLTPFPLNDGKEGTIPDIEVFQYLHLSL